MKCLPSIYADWPSTWNFFHPISPLDLKLNPRVGRESLGLLYLRLHFSVLIRRMDMKYILIPIHTGFCLYSRAIQKIPQARYSILQMWFQAIHISSLSYPVVTLAKQHPQTTAHSFPGAASWHLYYWTKKWRLFLPVKHCYLLWDEKIVTVSDSWLIQADKILVFQ